MNDEYIKREAVIKGFTDLLQKPGNIYPTDITTMMQRIPAEDVRPNVKGKWQIEFGKSFMSCSECGFCIVRLAKFNYCPNCGADMRENIKLE